MKNFWMIVLFLGLSASCAQALDTIWIVRHAEKEADWPEARELDAARPLNAEGIARSERIATGLSGEKILAVLGSPTSRSLHTGLPTARAHGCALLAAAESVDREGLAAWMEELTVEYPDPGAILVVGHSNTVPWLLEALGAEADCFADLGVSEKSWGLGIDGYDGVWRVDLAEDGCARFTRFEWH